MKSLKIKAARSCLIPGPSLSCEIPKFRGKRKNWPIMAILINDLVHVIGHHPTTFQADCRNLQRVRVVTCFFFFSTQLYFTIFTFLFVTTRQSSTYQQSITDFKVRTLVCIRTLVTSDNTYTPNNAPKATGNGLIQYGTVITRSILLNFSQEITHSLPVRARNGCLLWVTSLIHDLLLSVQCCVYIRDKLDRVITAPDLTTQTSTVYIWQTILGDIIHNKTPDKWSMGY